MQESMVIGQWVVSPMAISSMKVWVLKRSADPWLRSWIMWLVWWTRDSYFDLWLALNLLSNIQWAHGRRISRRMLLVIIKWPIVLVQRRHRRHKVRVGCSCVETNIHFFLDDKRSRFYHESPVCYLTQLQMQTVYCWWVWLLRFEWTAS